MPGFDDANGPSFFQRLAARGLAVRQASIGAALWKSPLATTVGVDQQKLDRGPTPPVANGSDFAVRGDPI